MKAGHLLPRVTWRQGCRWRARSEEGIGFLLLGALLFLGGCAETSQRPAYTDAAATQAPVAPRMGRVFVYRPARYVGSFWTPVMGLNGRDVGRSIPGESFYVDCPPGEYTLVALLGWWGVPDPSASFTVAEGQTVYVQFVAESAGWKVDVMPPGIGASEVRSTRFSRSSDFMTAGPVLKAAKLQAAEARRAGSVASLHDSPESAPAKPDRSETAGTPDEAERTLLTRSIGPGQGLYALDEQTTFNVLDSVTYDPASHMLSLAGHNDPKFTGPRIPYLQHLALLLNSPKPEFSLNWTPDSEQRIDAFFSQRQIEGMSSSEADALMAKWGKIVDDNLMITHAGELLLRATGLSPIEGRKVPGFAGLQTAAVPGTVWVRVTSVVPGSAAAEAGLRPGDVIKTIRGRAPLTPREFGWRVRMSGEGQSINLTYERPGNGAPTAVQLTLTASPDTDPWKNTSAYDLLKTLYWASGDPKAAFAIDIAGKMYRTRQGATEQLSTELRGLLINALGLRGAVNADLKAIDDNTMTDLEAMKDIYLKICQGMDETFHFNGSPVADAFLAAHGQRGGDPAYSVKPAFEEFSRQMVPKVEELLNLIFARPEGIQIPPELVDEQFHLRPEMVPEYLGVPEDAPLSQVLFASDYLGKRLMNRPELKAKIPNYLSGFEFEVKHPEFRHATGNYRIWISVGKMDTPQSPSGTTLALRDVRMRFNIRDHEGGRASESAATRAGRDLPNRPGSYEELLTSLWDDFEVEYPTLHELRETAKIAAAARWMLAHDPKASLPQEGRAHWRGPRRVPGLVFMELAPDPTLGMTKTHVTTIAEGGVSEGPPANFTGEPYPSDTSVVDLRGTSFGGPPAGSHVYTATAPSQGASDTASSPLAVGWVAPPDPSDGMKSAVVVKGVFGSSVVKADFSNEKAPAVTAGTDTRAGDQLKAAAAAGGNLTPNFDAGGVRYAGSLPTVTVDTSEVEKMKAWERMKNDPRMAPLAPLLEAYSLLQSKREQLNDERDRLTLERGQTRDSAKVAELTVELDQKTKEYQENLVALAAKKAEVEVEKKKLKIDTSEEGSTPPPDAPASPAAPTGAAAPLSAPNPATDPATAPETAPAAVPASAPAPAQNF